jgi:hypothetical protein
MNSAEFEHPPLGHIIQGLSDTETLTTAEIKAGLRDKGYDPDALAARLKIRVQELSRESRLGWMRQAEVMQERLATALHERPSWVQRTAEEINAAFKDVVAGRYGPQGQFRVQSAFSNLTSVTLESKAAFLDEVDVLLVLNPIPPKLPDPT